MRLHREGVRCGPEIARNVLQRMIFSPFGRADARKIFSPFRAGRVAGRVLGGFCANPPAAFSLSINAFATPRDSWEGLRVIFDTPATHFLRASFHPDVMHARVPHPAPRAHISKDGQKPSQPSRIAARR